MNEKIKKIYEALGIILLVSIIIFIGLNILNLELNPKFFTFNRNACIEKWESLSKEYERFFGGRVQGQALEEYCKRPPLIKIKANR